MHQLRAEYAADQQRINTIKSAPVDQQFNAVTFGAAFVKCKETLTGQHVIAKPADAEVLSIMLDPRQNSAMVNPPLSECDLHLGEKDFPESPSVKVSLAVNRQLGLAIK